MKDFFEKSHLPYFRGDTIGKAKILKYNDSKTERGNSFLKKNSISNEFNPLYRSECNCKCGRIILNAREVI